MAEFWDTHDTADYWDRFEEVDMEVEFPRRHRIIIEAETYKRIVAEANRRGVSPETLVNVWLEERLQILSGAQDDEGSR
jgi:hypothetical protein